MNQTLNSIPIGKLLRAENRQFMAGCRVSELETPAMGALVRVSLEDGIQIYGLITRIAIYDDGLVRQLVSGVSIPVEISADNRHNRNLPVEIHVLTVGYAQNGKIFHRLPPRPPLSLDALYLCGEDELVCFTGLGYGYLRHILRLAEDPVEEILLLHLSKAAEAQREAGREDWYREAVKHLIGLLQEDYQRLNLVLDALEGLEL